MACTLQIGAQCQQGCPINRLAIRCLTVRELKLGPLILSVNSFRAVVFAVGSGEVLPPLWASEKLVRTGPTARHGCAHQLLVNKS